MFYSHAVEVGVRYRVIIKEGVSSDTLHGFMKFIGGGGGGTGQIQGFEEKVSTDCVALWCGWLVRG